LQQQLRLESQQLRDGLHHEWECKRQDSSKARQRILQERMSVHEQAMKNEHGMVHLQAKSAKEKLNLESCKMRDWQAELKVTNLANEKLKASLVEAMAEKEKFKELSKAREQKLKEQMSVSAKKERNS
jgi:hypothetical protein